MTLLARVSCCYVGYIGTVVSMDRSENGGVGVGAGHNKGLRIADGGAGKQDLGLRILEGTRRIE